MNLGGILKSASRDSFLSSGVISQSISDYSKTVVKLLINQKPEADSDRAAMFIPHLAMAGQRILEERRKSRWMARF